MICGLLRLLFLLEILWSNIMIEWNGSCQRCHKKTLSHTMSWFNESLICGDCSNKETEHPRYNEAREAETKAVRSGNFNFKGIGYFG